MDSWIKGAGHFGISVADLDESIDFYQNLLGIKVSLKREKEAFDKQYRPKYKGKAFTHFGLTAPSVKAVFEFQEKLKNAGVEIIKEAYERWDGASFYFLDPNGHTLEYIYFDPSAEAPS